jgi:2-polyprenyl-3-methyl-5-hydroxy-6-metoxy-1,4-benzoquinol methylase
MDQAEQGDEVRAVWNANAEFWDNYMGEGGSFQRLLLGPALERWLELRPDELVLEVACGNGMFARRMAQLGARVVACDFAEKFLERAVARTTENADRIEYRRVDATDHDALVALGERRFDAAVCNMALMDMAAIDPLFNALAKLLKPNGRFVFSLTHPCFNSGEGMKRVLEEEDRAGELVVTNAIKITNYITPATFKGLGVIGQPVPQFYFHRPLSLLFNSVFRAGFVIDGMDEPVFPSSEEARRPFSWENFREIPPVLVARARLR